MCPLVTLYDRAEPVVVHFDCDQFPVGRAVMGSRQMRTTGRAVPDRGKQRVYVQVTAVRRSSPLARPGPRQVLEQELERYFGPSSARCKASCRATERTWVSTPDGVMVWLSGASPESRPGRAWRRQQLTLRDRASAASFSRSLRVVFPAGAFKAAAPGGLSSGAVSGGAMRRGRRGPCRPRHRTGRYPKTAATVRGTECVQST